MEAQLDRPVEVSEAKKVQQGLPLKIHTSRQFGNWLYDEYLSLSFTTYQSSRLGFIGVNERQRIVGFERILNRAMGLYVSGNQMYLSSNYQLWQLENVLPSGQLHDGHDRLFIPRVGYTTGDIDIHDLVVDHTGRIVFVSSLINCLATISRNHSCTPLWKPPFISKVVNEDRCHLNGLAMVEGMPRYVTAISRSDIVDGWRDKRHAGGCVIDFQSNDILVEGLSMPHSPRWYQDRLWLLNSGTGEFGYVDLSTGQFEHDS